MRSAWQTPSVIPGQWSQTRVFKVYSGAFLSSGEDVKRLMVAVIDGRPVYVRDIATVTEEPSDAGHSVGYYTGPAGDGTEAAGQCPRCYLGDC